MHAFPAWKVDASRILMSGELAEVLSDLLRRVRCWRMSKGTCQSSVCSCCCGLRASEIGGYEIPTSGVGISSRTSPRLLSVSVWEQIASDAQAAFPNE
jgi:hypothetical protein